MKRIFKLINNDIVFGKASSDDKGQVIIEDPYSIKDMMVHPYMSQDFGEGLPCLIIHPMNIVWSVPMEDIKMIDKVYEEAMTGIVTDTTPEIKI